MPPSRCRPRLDELPALCARSGSAALCNKVAEALWDGGRYLPARDALQAACERGGDPQACKRAAPLARLDAGIFASQPATGLPCGKYGSDTGLVDELTFGDRGLVESGFGTTMRARLEGGLVRMRHDKGGDFLFKVLPGKRLLGLDEWNRYALYELQGKPDRCTAPVAYRETPLGEGCPALEAGDAEACCKRGNLHGCNTVGNQLALGGDWAGAKVQYLKLCQQGVRIGCENLVQVYSRGGDEAVRGDLEKFCARDARHVACDVLETTAWEMLGLVRALEQAAGEPDAQDENATDSDGSE